MLATFDRSRKKPALPMPDLKEFFTSDEAAQELGYHVNHVRRMVKTGYLIGIKFGHALLISKKSVADFQAKTTKGNYQKHDRRKIEMLKNEK